MIIYYKLLAKISIMRYNIEYREVIDMRKITFIIIIALLCCIASPCIRAADFTDTKTGDWYFDCVNEMADAGLLTGYEDGTFRPQGSVTYAEFTAMIKRAAALEALAPSSSHWAGGIMKYAYEHGWYDYDEINESLYDAPVPRCMAAKLLALGLEIPAIEQENNSYYKYMTSVADFNEIDGRYAYLVVRGYCNGIFTGDENGRFNPKNSLTRAEACAMISRAALKAPLLTAAPAAPAEVISGGASENGWLSVSGTQLVNEAGAPVVLRGMSSHGLHWFGKYTSRAALSATAAYGANLFRAAMYTAEGGYISQQDECFSLMTTAIDNAIAEDMYVIADWHILSDGNPMTYLEQSKDFFARLSALYADSPNVIYEICNEPNGDVTWERDIKPYAEAVIPVIRANSPRSIILVGSGTWSQDFNDCADSPLAFDNVMYTCHFYAGTHGGWLRDRIDYALSKGAPIFVSEWGTSAADGNGGVYADETRVWLDFLRERGISRANWSLCDKAESSAALISGTADNAISDAALTESGRLVFADFR